LCAVFLILSILSGCGKGGIESESVSAHFEGLEGFTAQIKLLTNLDTAVLEYGMDYVYRRDDNDEFTITAPESLEGISGEIAGTNVTEGFSLQYDGMALDDAMPQRPGLTPADGFFALMSDLVYSQPAQVWTENASGNTLTVLRYESETDGVAIEKQVWLTDKFQPVCAELFADGNRVLTIQVTGYQEKT